MMSKGVSAESAEWCWRQGGGESACFAIADRYKRENDNLIGYDNFHAKAFAGS